MINPNNYSLIPAECSAIEQQLAQVGTDPTLEKLWGLMDQAWERCGCDNRNPDPDRLATFYTDPVWLLNGMFIEQHDVSMGHRQSITAAIAALAPERVLDFGGGFGTLARLLAKALPKAEVAICEPYPASHGIESCKPFANILFIPELTSQSVDVLVSTDVLEHVSDPLSLLAAMVDAVRPGGHLLIANCFYPVIACHLPCTFHLRYSFDAFCQALGLEVLGPCEGSHATIYRRAQVLEPDWPRLRAMEQRSQRLFPWREWRTRHLTPWRTRAELAVTHPLHYPPQAAEICEPQALNILHVNASDISGGAAHAAFRIHRSLVEHGAAHGLMPQMRVVSQLSVDPTVIGGPPTGQSPIWRRLQPRIAQQARRGFRTGNPTLHSLAWPATGLGAELQHRHRQGQADLVHLHWLGDGTLSIEEIGRLPMPLLWTLHDQWAFCGAEHYTSPPLPGETASRDERFAAGYSRASRPAHEAGPDLNRRTWLRKRRAWRKPIHIVCPSRWLADCARRSTLIGDWPIKVIPYPIDLNVWAPCDQAQARALLGLPAGRPLVLFGAMGGSADPRKGADLLLEALQRLRSQVAGTPLEQLELVVFGQSRPAQPPDLGFPIHYSGHLHDDLSLRLLYAAADVFVIPSRQDNLPNTGLEAHACGTPVVAFATGGLVDIVDHHITGALAEPFDPLSLAAAIRWVLQDPQRRRQLGAEARQRAERLWEPARVAGLYAGVYRQALEQGLQNHS